MDNLSHTLAGFLLAEAVIQFRLVRGLAPSARFPRAAYVVSGIANNLPDLDFLYSRITQPARPLGYLMHHRGHSHTVLVALAISITFIGLVRFITARGWVGARFDRELARGERGVLEQLFLVGPLVHLSMDFTNNYGVHPFWPAYRGWFYGDFIFIAEPSFLMLGLPIAITAMRSKLMRGLFLLVLSALIGIALLVPFVPWTVTLAMALLAGLAFFAGRVLSPPRRILFALSGSLLIAAVFFGMHERARRSVVASLGAGASLEDVALTVAPGNPLCWSVWRVSSTPESYVAESGVVSAWPELMSVNHCHTESDASEPTAPLLPASAKSNREQRWSGRFVAPRAALSKLNAENCFVNAYLRYSRVPYWVDRGRGLVVGDLRYDRRPELEFADFEVPTQKPCPRFVPNWLPPREELLR